MAPPTTGVSIRHGLSAGPGPGDDDETCPVCKTTRYFNKDMEFLIHPECYHRMCRTCVERIFKDGPNQCPYAGCHKTLRLRGFKSAYFGDLGVEREVDIRRRVAAVFNKVEDDFDSLESYNEYLYMVECLTDDLVNGNESQKRTAESQLSDWEAQHKADIERNRRLARESDETRQKRLAAEQDVARQRRLQELQDDEAERESNARLREEALDTLVNAEMGQATAVMKKIELKKRGGQLRPGVASSNIPSVTGLSIRGLREKPTIGSESVSEGPYDPYGGLDLAPTRVDLSSEKLQSYTSEWVSAVRTKHDYTVGGYSSEEYLSRALFEAFSGLGVFINEEKGQHGGGLGSSIENTSASTITAGGGGMDLDDPF